MTQLERALCATAEILTALKVRFALVGGLAVSARSEPRFTRDVDIAIAVVDDRDAERVVSQLMGRGYEVVAQVEQEAVGRFATARLIPPSAAEDSVVVDLLFASSGIEQELVQSADPLEIFPQLTLPIATTAHLLALKVLSLDEQTRPQDKIDILALLRVADPESELAAEAALQLITARGFHRKKDLVETFRQIRAIRRQ